MSEQPPLDVVKVEVVVDEDDNDAGGATPSEGIEVDTDEEVLTTVASLLSNGPWLSRGSEEGERFVRKLLTLGEKLVGWKEWERLCRSKQEENRDLAERLETADWRFERVKKSKAELRKTYDLEVKRRGEAELEVAKLRREAEEEPEPVTPVVQEAGVQTPAYNESGPSCSPVLQQAHHSMTVPAAVVEEAPLQEEGETPSIPSDDVRGRSIEEVSGSVDTIVAPRTSYNLRRRSSRRAAPDLPQLSERTGPASRKKLNRSSKKHHKVKAKRGRYPCYVCNKRFLHSNLLRHLKTHPEGLSYNCKTCGKRSKSRACLQKHLKIHDPNRERKYECPACTKKYYGSTALKRHLLVTHRGGEKPFKCPHCAQRFQSTASRKKHLGVHSRRRPFKCELCKKSFGNASDLRRHRRTHQGDTGKIHHCPFCSMKFVQSTNCRRHQRRRHNSELELASAAAKPEGMKDGPTENAKA